VGIKYTKNALKIVIEIPPIPFPNITAPIYFYGKILASPYTDPYIIPVIIPNTNRTKKTVQNAKSGLEETELNTGIRILIKKANKNPYYSLNLSVKLSLYTIIITYVNARRPLTAKGNTNAG